MLSGSWVYGPGTSGNISLAGCGVGVLLWGMLGVARARVCRGEEAAGLSPPSWTEAGDSPCSAPGFPIRAGSQSPAGHLPARGSVFPPVSG